SVDVGLREDHGEASQFNIAESRTVNDEFRLLESQIKLKEAEAKAKEVGIRQAEAEAKAKKVSIRQAKADSENLRLRIQLGQSNPSNTDDLTPRSSFSHFDPARAARLMPNFVRDWRSWTRSPPNGASKFSTYTCSFCGKPGHKAELYWTRLQPNTGKPAMIVTAEANTDKADSMPIALVSTKGEARESAVSVLVSRDFDLFQESFAKGPDVGTFRPFLSQGTVEVDGVETPVTILRDSGCLQTLIKERVVAARKTDKYVDLGSLWGQGVAPLVLPACTSCLLLEWTSYSVTIWRKVKRGNVTPPPVLRERPESTAELQQLQDDMPGVFPLCAVTRSVSMTNDHNVTPHVDDSLSLEGLFANPIASQDISSAVDAVTGRVALI
ncbi:hypothetical protein Hamer_G006782, partial [Homarus americanus]